MTDLTSFINIAPTNSYFFTNACNNDLTIFTEAATQNIHIGTLSNNKSIIQISSNLLSVGSHIYPLLDSVYDLGSSNNRFRDLYLKGNTIDLGGTKITRDTPTGGVAILDQNNNYTNVIVKQIQVGDNSNSIQIKVDSLTNQVQFR